MQTWAFLNYFGNTCVANAICSETTAACTKSHAGVKMGFVVLSLCPFQCSPTKLEFQVQTGLLKHSSLLSNPSSVREAESKEKLTQPFLSPTLWLGSPFEMTPDFWNCEYACLGECRFRAPGPKSEKNRRKIDFGLTRKIGEKSPKNRQNGPKLGLWPFLFYFWAIFFFLFSG